MPLQLRHPLPQPVGRASEAVGEEQRSSLGEAPALGVDGRGEHQVAEEQRLGHALGQRLIGVVSDERGEIEIGVADRAGVPRLDERRLEEAEPEAGTAERLERQLDEEHPPRATGSTRRTGAPPQANELHSSGLG